VLERVNAMESDCNADSKQKSWKTDQSRVVNRCGTNRIGGSGIPARRLKAVTVGNLGQTSTLGGGEMPATMAPATAQYRHRLIL